ncbi:MAG: NADH-quinone oxidoreductase subunit C [Gammaproteobacteria bacterium]|nr:NADH-quinone oxidoreductase subunit C [Gammaproteobacteria bacterium]
MSDRIEALAGRVEDCLRDELVRVSSTCGQLTYEVPAERWRAVAERFRDEAALGFEMLVDLCVVDYADYGRVEWQTFEATASGFSRGVNRSGAAAEHFAAVAAEAPQVETGDAATAAPGERGAGRRFGVVCHLLSLQHNCRVRLRAWCPDDDRPMIDSLVGVWASANWFEREAFDLFGVLFRGHPDLRRILTDYGFIGHPFRKDFPLIGQVEVRYDPAKGRVVYEPVSIEPRTLVPKVIRDDHRYEPQLHDEASFREVGNRA